MNDPKASDDDVITPGGPRPAGQVHSVGPDQKVRRDAGDNYHIVSKEGETGESQAVPPEDLVPTPGGYRPKSLIHAVEPGHVLRMAGGRILMVNAAGQVVTDFGPVLLRPRTEIRRVLAANVAPTRRVPPPGPIQAPGLRDHWITFAGWQNQGPPITMFSTTWVVPPAPRTNNGQLIYLFNGMTNAAYIYQPVLQWGQSPIGGGNFWAIASWYVDGPKGKAFHSSLVPVKPGDTVVGVITLTGNSASLGKYNYNCQFQGIPNASLAMENIDTLDWCCQTLEAYRLKEPSDYPNTDDTEFGNIEIRINAAAPPLNWTAVPEGVSDCGQHTVVASNANPNGRVDIFYRSAPEPIVARRVSGVSSASDRVHVFTTDAQGGVYYNRWSQTDSWLGNWYRLADPSYGDGFTVPPGSPLTSLSRFQGHIDLFTVGRDGGIYGTGWDQNDGWAGDWYRVTDPSYGDQFTVPPGSPITAVSRYPEHLDLFVVGRDGGVYTTWWDQKGDWPGQWDRITDPGYGDQFTVDPGTPVVAVSRFKEHLDLFVVGRGGGVYGTSWDESTSWAGHWYRVTDPGYGDQFTVPPGSPITALSRFREHLDLFVVGRDGGIYCTWWDQNGNWPNRWYRL